MKSSTVTAEVSMDNRHFPRHHDIFAAEPHAYDGNGVGADEIDEVYVGIDKHDRQYVIPVQAKGGKDRHGMVQTLQDITCCAERFPSLLCRPISAQFMGEGRIALIELMFEDGEMGIVEEKHYNLVPSSEISADDLRRYQ